MLFTQHFLLFLRFQKASLSSLLKLGINLLSWNIVKSWILYWTSRSTQNLILSWFWYLCLWAEWSAEVLKTLGQCPIWLKRLGTFSKNCGHVYSNKKKMLFVTTCSMHHSIRNDLVMTIVNTSVQLGWGLSFWFWFNSLLSRSLSDCGLFDSTSYCVVSFFVGAVKYDWMSLMDDLFSLCVTVSHGYYCCEFFRQKQFDW